MAKFGVYYTKNWRSAPAKAADAGMVGIIFPIQTSHRYDF
jgi:hypothetical protein